MDYEHVDFQVLRYIARVLPLSPLRSMQPSENIVEALKAISCRFINGQSIYVNILTSTRSDTFNC
jgi:hypothetical protein